jgi:hypothetical protein
LEVLRKNWWWIYSVVSGVAMVFYLSAMLKIERLFNPFLALLPKSVIAMGAISSALFYTLMRWPATKRKSAYLFACFYGLLLSGGAYIIQCFQYTERSWEWSWFQAGILILTVLFVVFYSPSSFRLQWGKGLRKYYLLKPLIVAWCWTVWALMPLIFAETIHLVQMMIMSISLIFALVLITDIIDDQVDVEVKTMVSQWGRSLTIVVLLIIILLNEVFVASQLPDVMVPGIMTGMVALPLLSLIMKKNYLSALLVDAVLILLYFLLR